MTPEEAAVYDNYLEWFAQVLAMCAAAQHLPLEQLLQVNQRITLTGGLIGPQRSEKATVPAMLRQRELIQKVIAFRDSLVREEPQPGSQAEASAS